LYSGWRSTPQYPDQEPHVQYLLMIHADEDAVQSASEETIARAQEAYTAYTQALQRAGVYVGSNRLQHAASAKTVRVRNGATSVVDGPFTETKEQLGGYYLIDVPDFETAVSWAARCPGAAHGSMEVRPVWSR
jgi:hypothetical protein